MQKLRRLNLLIIQELDMQNVGIHTYIFPSKQLAVSSISPAFADAFDSHFKQDISLNTDFLKCFVRESSTILSTQSRFVENMYGISEIDMWLHRLHEQT